MIEKLNVTPKGISNSGTHRMGAGLVCECYNSILDMLMDSELKISQRQLDT